MTDEELEELRVDLDYWWEEPESDEWFEKVSRLIRQTPAIIEELQQHRRLLRQIAEIPPTLYDREDVQRCVYCGPPDEAYVWTLTDHKPDCLWLRAKKLVEDNDQPTT